MSKKEVQPAVNALSAYNDNGEELLDSTPMALPVGFKRPIPLSEEIRQMIIRERQTGELDALGMESFEEADDFEIEDEDMSSPWEENFDTGKVWTREAEIRAGIVNEPDYQAAKKAVKEYERNKRLSMRRKSNPPVLDGEDEDMVGPVPGHEDRERDDDRSAPRRSGSRKASKKRRESEELSEELE